MAPRCGRGDSTAAAPSVRVTAPAVVSAGRCAPRGVWEVAGSLPAPPRVSSCEGAPRVPAAGSTVGAGA